MNLSNIALMFPGQGSQSVGMGRDLAENFIEYRNTLNEASDVLGFDMAQLCFQDKQNQLGLTEYTQPALLATSIAAFRTLANRAKLPQIAAVAGHSLGEYSALVCAGALEFSDALKAVRFRGQAMQRAVPVGMGAMAAYVGAQGEKVVTLCRELSTEGSSVEPVNFNSPSQIVLSGHKDAVESAIARITAEKLGRGIPLPVSAPFHSSLMQPAAAEMEQYLESVKVNALNAAIYANIDAQKYTGSTYTKAHLVRQVSSAVLWTQTLESIHSIESPELWLEVGSGGVLQGLLKKTIANSSCAGTQDLEALTTVLTKLGA